MIFPASKNVTFIKILCSKIFSLKSGQNKKSYSVKLLNIGIFWITRHCIVMLGTWFPSVKTLLTYRPFQRLREAPWRKERPGSSPECRPIKIWHRLGTQVKPCEKQQHYQKQDQLRRRWQSRPDTPIQGKKDTCDKWSRVFPPFLLSNCTL